MLIVINLNKIFIVILFYIYKDFIIINKFYLSMINEINESIYNL